MLCATGAFFLELMLLVEIPRQGRVAGKPGVRCSCQVHLEGLAIISREREAADAVRNLVYNAGEPVQPVLRGGAGRIRYAVPPGIEWKVHSSVAFPNLKRMRSGAVRGPGESRLSQLRVLKWGPLAAGEARAAGVLMQLRSE